ncbi:MAG: ATP-binding protein [Chitinophagaceae bacterium]
MKTTTITTPTVSITRRYTTAPSLVEPLASSQIMQPNSSEFAVALAHEIRNPLVNINLAMEILKRMIIDDAQKKYLDIIMRGSARINNIVSDLLVNSEVEKVVPEKYSIHGLLDEVLALIDDRIVLKNITVSKSYAVKDAAIVLNRPEMKIALINIIINAIEAMTAEQGQLKISTRLIKGNCVIEIKDNGIGISKENLKTIFEPHVTNKPGGIGLGLSTTQSILVSNHVRVNVLSVVGAGTTFILLFEDDKKIDVADQLIIKKEFILSEDI